MQVDTNDFLRISVHFYFSDDTFNATFNDAKNAYEIWFFLIQIIHFCISKLLNFLLYIFKFYPYQSSLIYSCKSLTILMTTNTRTLLISYIKINILFK